MSAAGFVANTCTSGAERRAPDVLLQAGQPGAVVLDARQHRVRRPPHPDVGAVGRVEQVVVEPVVAAVHLAAVPLVGQVGGDRPHDGRHAVRRAVDSTVAGSTAVLSEPMPHSDHMIGAVSSNRDERRVGT